MVGAMTIILDDETTWPTDVLAYLEHKHDLFLAWEHRGTDRESYVVGPSDYDNAIYGLRAVLNGYLLRGYHCTRLTESEMQNIMLNGMQLPNDVILRDRIRSVQNAGLIDPRIAERLIIENQAGESNRAKIIWFCFFPPHIAGQEGIERFFRSWGGEALYNSHERDPITGPILRSIGTPCIIEADLPIANLKAHSFLDEKVIRRFLTRRGYETTECVDLEDSATSAILSQNIRRIICHSDPDFITLTGCNNWSPPLTS